MRSDNGMFVFFIRWDKFVKKAEKLIDLGFGKVSVIGSIFYFECVGVIPFARHYVRERVKAGIADWNADGVVPVLLEKFDKYAFAVETPFAPSAKRNFVNFFHGISLVAIKFF